MNTSENLSTSDLLRAIPSFSFDETEVYTARQESSSCGLLGACYLPNPPFDVSLRPQWRNWHDEFENDFAGWKPQFGWLPERNRKNEDFARPFYYNPRSRQFIENLEPSVGQLLIKRLSICDIGLHLQWMLTVPSDINSRYESFEGNRALTDFAITFCNFLIEVDENKAELIRKKIPLSLDGDAARQFWTIAPYLHSELMNMGKDEHAALDTVIEWGGSRETPEYSSKPGQNSDYPGMKGLRKIQRGNEVGWYLTPNSGDMSHQLSKNIAKYIAQHLSPIFKTQKF